MAIKPHLHWRKNGTARVKNGTGAIFFLARHVCFCSVNRSGLFYFGHPCHFFTRAETCYIGSLGTAKCRAVPKCCCVSMRFASVKMGEKDEGKKTEKRTNRGITWPDTSTISLLKIWQEEEIRISLDYLY